MLLVLVILAVLGILFGAAALATYEGDVLRDPHPDDRPATLPTAALQPEDVAELRFDLALRGYRMSEVDTVLQRVAEELAVRDARIAELEEALSEPAPAPVEPAPADPEPVAPQTFAPLAPPAAAPAVVAGPLTATTWWADEAPAPEPGPASAPVETADAPVEQTQAEEPVEEPVVASAQVDTADAPVEQTHAEEPVVASAQVDTADAPVEQTQAEEQPEDAAPAPSDVPASVPEPPALTLPAADDAFSFPELQLPEPAVEEPEQSKDWWSSLQEPPSGEGPGRT